MTDRSTDSIATDPPTLHYEQVYPCPVCRHGELTGMVLMDAFACNFCRHIFTANLEQQQIRLADSAQSFFWRWNGRKWKSNHRQDFDLTFGIWLLAFILATVPGGLLWLGYYVFPPLPDSRWAWFPLAWMGLAFLVHLSIVFWLLLEYYQVPLYLTSRLQMQRWQQRS